MNEYIIPCNSTNLNYIDCLNTQGLPVLLLHGIINRWQSFLPIIPDLHHSFRVYALDLRGHGKSDRTPGEYTLENFIEDCYCFIKEQIKQPVIIIGHSFGGMIGMLLAAYHPELVRALVIVDTPLTIASLQKLTVNQKEQANLFIQWLRFNNLSETLTGWDNNWIPEGLRSCDPEMLVAMINSFDRTFKEFKPNKLLPSIRCPVLLIRGNPAHGGLISDNDFKNALKLLPHLSHVMIHNAGHSPIRQDTDAVLAAIAEFMKTQRISIKY